MTSAPGSPSPARRRGPCRVHLRTGRGLVVLSAVLAALLVLAIPASAYWTTTGSGAGSGTTGTLAPPTGVTVPTNTLSSVAMTWTGSGGSLAPEGYFVTRTSGGTTVAACASSPTALLTGTSCTDTSVPDGSYTYTVTAKYRSWTAASAPNAGVTVWTPTKVAFTGQPSNTIAGAAITPAVAVSVQNAAGVAVPLSGTSVTVAIGTNPGGGTLSGTASGTTNSSGVVTFAGLSINKAGVGYTLGATSSGLTSATSGTFTISAAATASLAFTTNALSATASDTADLGPITVRTEDALGNPTVAPVGGTAVVLTSDSTGTKRFSDTSGLVGTTTTLTVTIAQGASSTTFYYGDRKSGSPTITAAAAGLSSASQAQTINPAAATKLAITSTALSGAASATANLGPVRIQRQDTYGNPVTAGSTSVALSSNSAGTAAFSSTSLTIGSGSSYAEFNYGDTKSGAPVITATSSGLTQVTQTQTINPAAASKFLITSTAVSGVAVATATLGPITVERRDTFNNLVTAGSTTANLSSNSAGTARFAATSGGATIGSVTINNGASNTDFFYGDTKAASPTITVSGLTTDATQAATIAAATPAKFVITSAPVSGIARTTATLGPITVQRQDSFGNPASPASTTTVNLATNSTGLTKFFSATSGGVATTAVTIASGTSSVNFFYADTRAASPIITVSGLTTDGTQTETITPAGAHHLAFGTQPQTGANIPLGDVIPITARVLDQWDNQTFGTADVEIEIANWSLGRLGTLYGDKTRSATNGVATFDDLTIGGLLDLVGRGNGYILRMKATNPTLSFVSSNAFDIV